MKIFQSSIPTPKNLEEKQARMILDQVNYPSLMEGAQDNAWSLIPTQPFTQRVPYGINSLRIRRAHVVKNLTEVRSPLSSPPLRMGPPAGA